MFLLLAFFTGFGGKYGLGDSNRESIKDFFFLGEGLSFELSIRGTGLEACSKYEWERAFCALILSCSLGCKSLAIKSIRGLEVESGSIEARSVGFEGGIDFFVVLKKWPAAGSAANYSEPKSRAWRINWSRAEVPGRSGRPVRSSAAIQPIANMSTGGP